MLTKSVEIKLPRGLEARPVAELVQLEKKIAWADLVISGEGCIDGQSLHGKTPVGIARIAKRHGKAVIAIGGSLLDGAESVLQSGIDAIASTVAAPKPLKEILQNAHTNLRQAAFRVACLLKLGQSLAPKIEKISIKVAPGQKKIKRPNKTLSTPITTTAHQALPTNFSRLFCIIITP